MDKITILRVLDFCATYYPDKTAAACSGYLERLEKLDWEQKEAVVQTLLSILRHETVSCETYDSVFKTTVKLLQQPIHCPNQILKCVILYRPSDHQLQGFSSDWIRTS
ncbi:hypothetical protein NDU88_000291 [Pleurodeles waltl]|uniref:Uncharacterized protein n=1 Tax=Pleurodeles waltl TaxID=8319 RepID=A0AAV7TEH0_PLEWA|nr:hypothetical protein NDU88_000291 [Pleurodeles waltl]